MKKETANPQEYSANFKLQVILDVLNNGLSIHEAVRRYWNVTSHVDIREDFSMYFSCIGKCGCDFSATPIPKNISCARKTLFLCIWKSKRFTSSRVKIQNLLQIQIIATPCNPILVIFSKL